MKTCEVLDLAKVGKVVYSLSLAVLEGEHSLHCFKKWFHWA